MLAPKLMSSSDLGMGGMDRLMRISNVAQTDKYGCEQRYILMEVIPEVIARLARLIERLERKILSDATHRDVVFLSVSIGMMKEELELLEMLIGSLEAFA